MKPSLIIKSLCVSLLVSVIGLFFLYGKAEGADWKPLYIKGATHKIYYDAESIVHINKNIMRVWFKHIGGEDATVDPKTMKKIKSRKVKESLDLYEFDCNQRMYRLLYIETSYEDGGWDKTENYNGAWFHIQPESFMEILHKAICPLKGKH